MCDTSLGALDDQKVSQAITPHLGNSDTLTEQNSENDEVNRGTDINDNMVPKPSRNSHTKSSQDDEASDPDSPHSKLSSWSKQ